MAPAIRDARIEVIPGAGHAVHLEQPLAVAKVIAERPGRRRG
jgi:pimeloyl-ACP methyl ester carboxylesterase